MQWLAEICVHRPVFATVIVLFLTVVGGFSFFTLGVDRFPKIDVPTISISTSNSGNFAPVKKMRLAIWLEIIAPWARTSTENA